MRRRIPEIIFIFILLFSPFLRSEESFQFLGDQITEDENLNSKSLDKIHESSPFLNLKDQNSDTTFENKITNENNSSQGIDTFNHGVLGGGTLEEINSKVTPQDLVKTPSGHILGEFENSDKLLKHRDEKTFKDFKKKGETNYSFIFSKDTFTYKDKNNSFENIFRKSQEANFPGSLRLSWQKFFLQGFFGRIGSGLGSGIGYNGGKGIFVDGQVSEYNFSLWTIPLDWIFVYELPIFSLFKIGMAGGPSLLLLLQNRTDLEDGSKKKSVEQWGRGYFAEAFIRFNLVSIFSINHYVLYTKYSVTDFYLTINMRTQNYTQFKSQDISVSGKSFGAGLTFEVF